MIQQSQGNVRAIIKKQINDTVKKVTVFVLWQLATREDDYK